MAEPNPENMSPEEIAELQKKNCIFCRIIKGEIPSQKVYEDDKIIAIMDIKPAAKGHVLVMPKEHYPILPLVPEETFTHMFAKTKTIAEAVKKAALASSVTIFIANGAAAGQMSPHFLYHLIPREEGDGLPLEPPEKEIPAEDRAEVAEALKTPMSQVLGAGPQMRGDVLAQKIETDENFRKTVMEEPEKLKRAAETNPQLKQLFEGINIDQLSERLKAMAGEPKEAPEEPAGEETRGEPEKNFDLDKISKLFK